MTGRVQFREDEDRLSFVEDQGVNPNELARRLFREEVRRMRADDRMKRLRERGIQIPGNVAHAVREDRESR